MSGRIKTGTTSGSNYANSASGANIQEDAVVQFSNTNSNIGDSNWGHTDPLAEWKYVSGENKLQLSTVQDSGKTLKPVMTVNKDGKIDFNTSVNFNSSAGETTINTTTTSIQDQQLEIGLADPIEITKVTTSVSNNAYTYRFHHKNLDAEPVGGNWTLDTSEKLWTTSEAHGLHKNDTIMFMAQAGVATGFDLNVNYWVADVVSTTTVKLATSLVNSNAGTYYAGTADSTGNWEAYNTTGLGSIWGSPSSEPFGYNPIEEASFTQSSYITYGAATSWTYDYTGGAAEDLWSNPEQHHLNVGDIVKLSAISSTTAGFDTDTAYYVYDVPTSKTMRLKAAQNDSSAGAVVEGTANLTGGTFIKAAFQNAIALSDGVVTNSNDQVNENGAGGTTTTVGGDGIHMTGFGQLDTNDASTYKGYQNKDFKQQVFDNDAATRLSQTTEGIYFATESSTWKNDRNKIGSATFKLAQDTSITSFALLYRNFGTTSEYQVPSVEFLDSSNNKITITGGATNQVKQGVLRPLATHTSGTASWETFSSLSSGSVRFIRFFSPISGHGASAEVNVGDSSPHFNGTATEVKVRFMLQGIKINGSELKTNPGAGSWSGDTTSNVWTTTNPNTFNIGNRVDFPVAGTAVTNYAAKTAYYIKTILSNRSFQLSNTFNGSVISGDADTSDNWKVRKTNKVKVDDFYYIQNAKKTDGSATASDLKSACKVSAVGYNYFEVNKINNSDITADWDGDEHKYVPVAGRLETITENSGIHVLGVDSSSLVSGSLSFDSNSSKKLVLKNDEGDINLTPSTGSDINIPADIGLKFGTGEKIEGDNTDLTVTSGAKINLTATSDVVIPSGVGLILDGSGDEKIESNGTDLTITSGGDIALSADDATTSGGGVKLDDGSNQYIRFESYNDGTTDGNCRIYVNDNKALLLHKTSTTDVVDILHTGAFTSTSDRNLKTNIVPLENSVEKIKKLKGVNFNWKGDSQNEEQTGFIAQEVEEIIPSLVKTNEEGVKSVSYIQMIAILADAIKEQQTTIDSLQNQINDIKD